MRPRIGITMGEPRGIGPEVLVQSLAIDEIFTLCQPVVFGPEATFHRVLEGVALERSVTKVNVQDLEAADWPVKDLLFCDSTKAQLEASTLAAIDCCTDLCADGHLQAMVTGPVDKYRLNAFLSGKKSFWGHTEYLAERLNTKRVAMMLAGDQLRVVPVTVHCALRDVAENLTLRKIVDAVELTALSLKEYWRIGEPRIGVSALNPHAGEKGLMGSEEEELILPAVEKCRLNGIDVRGPLAADGLFATALRDNSFDAIVTMYHDQALIPLKMLHFRSAVNITLGLPIIRTSVDHGTAYDLVGKGVADPSSMIEAIRIAAKFCRP